MSHSGSGFTAPLRDLALIFGLEVRTTATKFGSLNQDLFFVLQFPGADSAVPKPLSIHFLFFGDLVVHSGSCSTCCSSTNTGDDTCCPIRMDCIRLNLIFGEGTEGSPYSDGVKVDL